MKSKLSSRKGFTITEILMTVLVISMVTAVVGGGVVVVKDAYMKITLKAEAETLRSTALTEVMDELRFAQNIRQEDDPENPSEKICTFDSQSRQYRIYFSSDKTEGICVNSCQSSGTKLPLLTKQTMSSKLIPRLTSLNYSPTSGQFEVKIEVYTQSALDAGTPLVTMDPIVVQAINYKK